jgi:hypothetical protein
MLKKLEVLIEHSEQDFYGHFNFPFNRKGEIQRENNQWRYRPVAYAGEWVYSELDSIPVDRIELETALMDFLLVEYSFLAMYEPNQFRQKQLEKVLGNELCLESVKGAQEFIQNLKNLMQQDHWIFRG